MRLRQCGSNITHCRSYSLPSSELLDTIVTFANTWQGVATMAVTTSATLSSLVPRVGPGRALGLAAKSVFFFRPTYKSVRTEEIVALNKMFAHIKDNRNGSYIVVKGAKGVGKSVLIDSKFSHCPGVLRVRVRAGVKGDAIVENVYREVARLSSNLFSAKVSARRVTMWFRFFFMGKAPIIVLEVSERESAKPFAELTSVVRELSAEGYKVVVDSSENSLSPEVTATGREYVLKVLPMSQTQLYRIPEFRKLFEMLASKKLDALVSCITGGYPVHVQTLLTCLNDSANAPVEEVVQMFVRDALSKAKETVMLSNYDGCGTIFKDSPKRPVKEVLKELNIKQFNSPDKVFRKIKGHEYVEAASPAVAFVLQHNLLSGHDFNNLESLQALADGKSSTISEKH